MTPGSREADGSPQVAQRRRGRRQDERLAGARRQLHNGSRDEAGGAWWPGGSFTSDPGPSAPGETGGALGPGGGFTSGPGRAAPARAEARRATRWGSATASPQVQVARRRRERRRGGRRAGARRRILCRSRWRGAGAGGGEAGGAREPSGGFTAEPGRTAPVQAGARRAAREGPVSASLQIQGASLRCGRGRDGRCTGVRRQLHGKSRSHSVGVSGGEAGGARGPGGAGTSGGETGGALEPGGGCTTGRPGPST
eukprot:tig00020571_g11499.t1